MSVLEELFVVWQDPKSLRYFPVGNLKHVSEGNEEYYEFSYIKGALQAKEHTFEPFLAFPKLEETYRSKELFTFFTNRILPHSREEYKEFVESLKLSPGSATEIEILARSGGRRATDSIELFAPPKINRTSDKNMSLLRYFFLAHGLRHMRDCAQKLAGTLRSGDRLFIMHDLQNPVDTEALVLRTQEYCCIGFLPRYLLADCWKLIQSKEDVTVTIEKLNPPPAPIQQRVLCRMETPWSEDFKPCTSEEYQPMIKNDT